MLKFSLFGPRKELVILSGRQTFYISVTYTAWRAMVLHALQGRWWTPGGPGWTYCSGPRCPICVCFVGQHQSVCIQAGGWSLLAPP